MTNPKIKAGTIVQYPGLYSDRVTAVVSFPYTSKTGEKCLHLTSGMPVREDLCTIVGFECPSCGRKYDDEPWECTSDDCPKAPPISKLEAYRQGKYIMPTPPVGTKLWSDQDWVNFIDRDGSWIAEVE